MTTGYDVSALVPENICGTCGQPEPVHLPMCQTLGMPQPTASPAVTPETLDAVNEQEKHLGEAI
jgi:hypothetical protein